MKTGFNISTGIFVGFYTFFSRISNRNERNKYCASKTKCMWKYNCAINRAELQDCFCIADRHRFSVQQAGQSTQAVWLNTTAVINLIILDSDFTSPNSSPSSAQNAVNTVYGLTRMLSVNLDAHLLKQYLVGIVKFEWSCLSCENMSKWLVCIAFLIKSAFAFLIELEETNGLVVALGRRWCIEEPNSASSLLESRRKLDVERPLKMLLPKINFCELSKSIVQILIVS